MALPPDDRLRALLEAARDGAQAAAFGHVSRAPEGIEADVCGKRCDHGSECMLLVGHAGGHETQHGCVFYDAQPAPRAAEVDAVRAFLAHPKAVAIERVESDNFYAVRTLGGGHKLYMQGNTPEAACEAALRALGASPATGGNGGESA